MTRQYENSAEIATLQEPPLSCPAANLPEIHIDDDWLEALLENLALASLSKRDCIALIEQIEDLERYGTECSRRLQPPSADVGSAGFDLPRSRGTELGVGGHFSAEFNEYEMRSPESMTGENVLDAIVQAVRHLGLQGHAGAVRQIVFFISSNLEEVIAESEDE